MFFVYADLGEILTVFQHLIVRKQPFAQYLIVDLGTVHQDTYPVNSAGNPGGKYESPYK